MMTLLLLTSAEPERFALRASWRAFASLKMNGLSVHSVSVLETVIVCFWLQTNPTSDLLEASSAKCEITSAELLGTQFRRCLILSAACSWTV